MKKILLLPLVLLSCLLQAQTMDYQQFMQRVARDNRVGQSVRHGAPVGEPGD